MLSHHTSTVLNLELFTFKKRSRGEEFLSQEHMENLQEPDQGEIKREVELGSQSRMDLQKNSCYS